MEWPESRCDGARDGEYTRFFDGRDIMGGTGEYSVLGLGPRDNMGREAVDGDGTRDEYSRIFDQWTQLAGMRCECVQAFAAVYGDGRYGVVYRCRIGATAARGGVLIFG